MATPSLAMIPSAYADSKVYSVLPNNGDGDFSFNRDQLLKSLVIEETVILSIEPQAHHEWTMKIMEFLQENKFNVIKMRTLKE